MNDPRRSDGESTELRQQAEVIIRGKTAPLPTNIDALTAEEMRQIIHELEVHQIELAMQNEALRKTQTALESAKSRYFDLYDLAPVGYVTLTGQGLIQEANLTAATWLGISRSILINRPMVQCIFTEDQDEYYLYSKKMNDTGSAERCELRLIKNDGTPFWVHLTSTVAQDGDGSTVYRVVFSDISELKQDEVKIRCQLDELLRWQGVMIGREERMMELKGEVNEFCLQTGKPVRYPSQAAVVDISTEVTT